MTTEERLKNYPLHESQRGYFGKALYEAMAKDPDIFLLTGDLGYKLFDPHRDEFPKRFINCGASESAMMGIAVGLAQEGKTVFVYTITSFFLRAAETISLYLSGEQTPVILVGGGRDNDYKEDGVSHYAYDAQDFIKGMKINYFAPEDKDELPDLVKAVIKDKVPTFISLRR